MFLLVATLATLVPPPPAPPAPRPETRLEALRTLADQATQTFRSGGLDLVKVNVVDALKREIARR